MKRATKLNHKGGTGSFSFDTVTHNNAHCEVFQFEWVEAMCVVTMDECIIVRITDNRKDRHVYSVAKTISNEFTAGRLLTHFHKYQDRLERSEYATPSDLINALKAGVLK